MGVEVLNDIKGVRNGLDGLGYHDAIQCELRTIFDKCVVVVQACLHPGAFNEGLAGVRMLVTGGAILVANEVDVGINAEDDWHSVRGVQ